MKYSDFVNVYDRYCPMLYEVALEICGSEKGAEELIMLAFKKIHSSDIVHENCPFYCITLIRLMIKTAREQYPEKIKKKLRLSQFKKAPLWQQLISHTSTLPDYCKENGLEKHEAMEIIRKEFDVISNAKMNSGSVKHSLIQKEAYV